jgi:ABC-type taurine transport system substrate-binding protein
LALGVSGKNLQSKGLPRAGPDREHHMKAASRISALLAGIAMVATASVAKAEEITVAYFLEWPMPFQYAKVKGLYDEASLA